MTLSLFAAVATIVSGTAITESIITGIGLGAGLYCASRTKQISPMTKKVK